MHRFELVDAHILLGLFMADSAVNDRAVNDRTVNDRAVNDSADISCMELLASCQTVNHFIPTLAELTVAFNKFLYAQVIILDENKLGLTNFGRQLVNDVKKNSAVAVVPDELAGQLFAVLAGYKLKSMCNRNIWTPQDYQQAVAAQKNNSQQ